MQDHIKHPFDLTNDGVGSPYGIATDPGFGVAPTQYAAVGDLGTFTAFSRGLPTTPGSRGGTPQAAPAATRVTTAGSSLVINLVWDSSVGAAPAGFMADMIAAARYLESQISNPVTINLAVGYNEIAGSTLQSGALGESETNLVSVSYANLVAALLAHASDATGASLLASLPSVSPVNGTYWLSTAQAKALGLGAANGASIDGDVGFGPSTVFSYGDTNTTGAVAPNTYDMFSTAVHEITEVMGRMLLTGSRIGNTTGYSLLDLMHYSASGTRDFVSSTAGYFSADGGATNLGAFNTVAGGDAGDWASTVADNAFDAYATSGVIEAVTSNDLTEMDAIGWSLTGSGGTVTTPSPPSPTPPPSPPSPSPPPPPPAPPPPAPPTPAPPTPAPPSPAPPSPAPPPSSPPPPAPTGVSITDATASLAGIRSKTGLAGGHALANIAQVGGLASDSFKYGLGGPGSSSFTVSASSKGATLAASSAGVAGLANGQLYALTVTANDTTAGVSSPAIPVDVIVGAGSTTGDTISVATLSAGLGMSTPTFIYGLSGNDTIIGTGMTGKLWLDGGAGADTMTGGSGVNDFVYGATSDSSVNAMDIIKDFHASTDTIDLTGLGVSLGWAGQGPSNAAAITGRTVGYVVSGGNAFLYVNASLAIERLTFVDMKIEVQGVTALTNANVLHV